MGCSCDRCVVLIVLLIAMIACTISFASPYWFTIGNLSSGLLGICGETQCLWFAFNGEYTIDNWYTACQVMFGLAILLFLVSLPCACVSVCCDTNGNVSRATGILLMVAGVFIVITLVVFGYFAHRRFDVIPFYNKPEGKYNWGYYMGVAGVIMDFIAGGLFLCIRKKELT